MVQFKSSERRDNIKREKIKMAALQENFDCSDLKDIELDDDLPLSEDELNGYGNYENTEIIPGEILELENLDEHVDLYFGFILP